MNKDPGKRKWNCFHDHFYSALACSKLAMKTPEQDVKSVES